MKTGQEIRLKQTQRFVLGHELRQAMAILQFSAQELADYVEQQLVENPMLELREEGNNEWKETKEADGDQEDYTAEWVEYFCDSSDLGLTRGSEPDSPAVTPEPPGAAPSLYEHLLGQIGLLRLPAGERLIGEYIIGNIGADGYLKATVEEMALSLGVPAGVVEKVLQLVQTLDPPGIGARSLKECLYLQAERAGLDQLVKAMITDYLEALAEGEIPQIARRLGVAVGEVFKAVETIRTLNPKPGSGFAGEPVQYIVPDVIIEKIGGEYVVSVNDNAYPRLRINHTYRELLRKGGLSAETKGFIRARLKQALWLVKSIEKRQATLYRIATALVEMQRGFLDAGVSALRPLTLRDVARAVRLHESTVSRAVAHKYVQCPRGIFKLKFFFDSGVSESGGKAMAARSVKCLIRDIVAAEGPENPLSDQEIARALHLRGIKLSRRTVAKYRADLGIPGAAKRRGRAEIQKKSSL
uniref:RNA polymerase sigma-54 factor n=1 Tax=Ammonifex degensii TaxID=42838 RepID=A0A7C2E250_9THEO